MGALAELLTTPAMAPNNGCARSGVTAADVAGVLESSAKTGVVPVIPANAVTINSAGTVRTTLDVTDLFITCLTSFSGVVEYRNGQLINA
jgi:hypothetical protein